MGREAGRRHTAKGLGAGVRLPGSNPISATYQLLNSDQSADLNFPICKMEGTKVPNSVCYKDQMRRGRQGIQLRLESTVIARGRPGSTFRL